MLRTIYGSLHALVWRRGESNTFFYHMQWPGEEEFYIDFVTILAQKPFAWVLTGHNKGSLLMPQPKYCYVQSFGGVSSLERWRHHREAVDAVREKHGWFISPGRIDADVAIERETRSRGWHFLLRPWCSLEVCWRGLVSHRLRFGKSLVERL
ncbi:MAG: hypothetical protein AAGA57_00900 [Planctomycetota bacterium]